MTRPVDIKDVVAQLTLRIEALCAEFFPKGRFNGRYCQVGSLAGEAGQSLAIYLAGARRGHWKDYATGEYGDALDLVAQALFMGDKRQAVQWSLRWLGYDVGGAMAPRATRPGLGAMGPPRDTEGEAAQAEKDRKSAHGIWLAGREGEQLLGSPVDRYLRGRGIDLRALPRLPGAIRFHPDLWHRPTRRHWPAMVAAIADHHGRFLAVHRTWLQITADNVVKAPMPNKMVWPAYHGGFIRLARGCSGKSLAQASAGEELWISEGIEDGLTAALAAPELRIIAAVSLCNIGNLEVGRFKRLHLLLQNDSNPKTLAQRDQAVRALQQKGHEVFFHRPPAAVKDINELLTKGAA